MTWHWLDAGGTVEQLLAICRAANAALDADATSGPWTSPDLSLLGTGRRPAPEFPIDLLGEFWSGWVRSRAAGASAPLDYIATALLAGVSAVIANVRWPTAGVSWSEPPVLWIAEVGGPSSGKSPSLDAVMELIQHAEDTMAASFDEDLRQYETDKTVAKARREAWETEVKAAVKAGDRAEVLPDDAVVPEEPVRARIRVADFTVEKLGVLAAALPRGLLAVRDELAGWFGSFDRYGGNGSDRAFALEMYGGRPYVVDRMKSVEPLRIRHLSVGLLGGVQPDKLIAIIDGPDDGLASRLLWAWPETIPEFRLCREPPPTERLRRHSDA